MKHPIIQAMLDERAKQFAECALGNRDSAREVTITCKTGPSEFKKHFLGLSDNVTFFVEQLGAADVSTFHYRVMFRPQSIIPDVDLQGASGELLSNGAGQ